MATVSTVATLSTPLIVRHLIDAAVAGQQVASIVTVAGALVLVYLLRALLNLGENVLAAGAGTAIARTLRLSMYLAMRDLPAGDHVAMKTGDISTRFGADAIAAQSGITRLVPDITRGVVGFSLALTLMYMLSPPLAAIGVVFVLSYWLASRSLSRRVDSLEDDAQSHSAQLTTQLNSSLGPTGIFVTQAIRRVGLDIRLIDEHAGAVAKSRETLSFWLTMQREILGVLSGLALALVYGYGLVMFATGGISLGSVVACAVFCGRLTAPLATFSNAGNRMTKALTSFAKISAYMDMQRLGENQGLHGRAVLAPGTPSLVFEAVELSFDATNQDSIRYPDISWTGPGLVIVEGRSGAGKTSLAKLACGLTTPSRGRVFVCGLPNDSLSRDEVASLCDFVAADSSLFSASVITNVTLDGASCDSRAKVVLKELGLDPELLGERASEFGASLSTGQRQRVALARALTGPCPVLLLDEPFANLDAGTALKVGELLQQAALERLVVLLGHNVPEQIKAMHRVVLATAKAKQSQDAALHA